MSNNRYAKENASRQIQGYFIPRNNESFLSAFCRARAEYIAALKIYIAAAEGLTVDEFKSNCGYVGRTDA